MRSRGVAAGMIKLRMFRPFPSEEIAKALSKVKACAVLDRSIAYGGDGGPVHIAVDVLSSADDERRIDLDLGGVTATGATFEIDGGVRKIWRKGGVFWRLGRRFNLGLDRRYSDAEVDLDFGAGVVAQNLFRRIDRKGRVAALEILVFTTAVANLVREGKTHQIPGMIQAGKRLGNQPLDDTLRISAFSLSLSKTKDTVPWSTSKERSLHWKSCATASSVFLNYLARG